METYKELNDEMILYNSADDLWAYLFYGNKLPNMFSSEAPEWFDDGIEWITGELLRGEIFAEWPGNQNYIFTNLGRFGNIKKKSFNKMNLQCHTICGNITGGAFSMTKMVRDEWGIELKYETLHPESKKLVNIRLLPAKKKKG